MKINLNKSALENLYDLIAVNNVMTQGSLDESVFTLGPPSYFVDADGLYNTVVTATSSQDAPIVGVTSVWYNRLKFSKLITPTINPLPETTLDDVKTELCSVLKLLKDEVDLGISALPRLTEYGEEDGLIELTFSAKEGSYTYIESGTFVLSNHFTTTSISQLIQNPDLNTLSINVNKTAIDNLFDSINATNGSEINNALAYFELPEVYEDPEGINPRNTVMTVRAIHGNALRGSIDVRYTRIDIGEMTSPTIFLTDTSNVDSVKLDAATQLGLIPGEVLFDETELPEVAVGSTVIMNLKSVQNSYVYLGDIYIVLKRNE